MIESAIQKVFEKLKNKNLNPIRTGRVIIVVDIFIMQCYITGIDDFEINILTIKEKHLNGVLILGTTINNKLYFPGINNEKLNADESYTLHKIIMAITKS